ncbi:hypothetical protein BDEG_23430 [Batrachochytrium dendrobatidis JEL423]|uniref:Mid2 domain-containing protein n=1 Tax=Batrachochytrium dendrobatidis (strain JEL423) TaxID=403673 RepID=A0A177WHK3_BATDL|nr:hypothetical protein BDEG_23430 [Batrachochytrium dendrobatidis JEL423]
MRPQTALYGAFLMLTWSTATAVNHRLYPRQAAASLPTAPQASSVPHSQATPAAPPQASVSPAPPAPAPAPAPTTSSVVPALPSVAPSPTQKPSAAIVVTTTSSSGPQAPAPSPGPATISNTSNEQGITGGPVAPASNGSTTGSLTGSPNPPSSEMSTSTKVVLIAVGCAVFVACVGMYAFRKFGQLRPSNMFRQRLRNNETTNHGNTGPAPVPIHNAAAMGKSSSDLYYATAQNVPNRSADLSNIYSTLPSAGAGGQPYQQYQHGGHSRV